MGFFLVGGPNSLNTAWLKWSGTQTEMAQYEKNGTAK